MPWNYATYVPNRLIYGKVFTIILFDGTTEEHNNVSIIYDAEMKGDVLKERIHHLMRHVGIVHECI